jgi:hypothetical protein
MSFKTAEIISLATKNEESFKDFLHEISDYVKAGGVNECRIIIDQIKKILKDKKTLLAQKLLGLELLHHCILLNKPEFLSYTQVKILKRLTILAQKDQKSILKDYPNTEENKEIASTFLRKLLNYIYIWANEYGQTSDKRPNDFAKEFYRLRETVTFPSPKKNPISRAMSTTTDLAIPKRPEKLSLEYVLKVLDALERMPDPLSSDSGLGMLESLREACPSIESSLSKALQSGSQKVIDRILKLNDRIQKVLKRCGMSEVAEEKQLRLEYRHSLPAAMARESVEQWGNAIEEEKVEENEKEVPKLMFSLGRTEAKEGNNTEKLLKEIEVLKSQINEKDSAYATLSEACFAMQSKITSLETALARTKALLLSKEKECEECHCLKPSLVLSEPEEPEILFDSSSQAQFNSPLLFEDQCSQISYQFSQENDVFILALHLTNKSEHHLSSISFEIDSAFGFDIQLVPLENTRLSAKKTLQQFIYAKNICMTQILPVVLFKYQCRQQGVQVSFSLPIHILRFCKPVFNSNMLDVWQEWEMLTFDTDIATIPVQFPFSHCCALLQMSQNALIITRRNINKLANNQLLALYSLNNRVFALLELKPFEMTASLEVRCESATLRKTAFTLLSKCLGQS